MSTSLTSSRGQLRLWFNIGAPVLAFVVVFAAAAGLLLRDIARQEDDAFRNMTKRMTASAVAVLARSVADQTLDYANWDAAFQAVSRRWDAGWLASNYYSSTLDALIVLREGQMRYLWTADHLLANRGAVARDAIAVARGLEGLDDLASAPSVSGTAAAALMTFQGRLALVAIVPVTLESDEARIAEAGSGRPQNFLLGIQVLDDDDLSGLARTMALTEFRFTADPAWLSEDFVAWPISEMSGQSEAVFAWRDERPGSAAFAGRVALAVIALLVLAAVAISASVALTLRSITPPAPTE